MGNTERTHRQGMEQKAQGQQPPLLGANHRRVLAATLRRVELAAWHLEDRIRRGAVPQLALTRYTDAPNAEQQAALLHLAARLRQEIASLATDYQLSGGEESFLRGIKGEFMILWADLEDMRPEKLRDYGPLRPQVDSLLTPRIERLIELALAISDVASGRPDSVSKWQHQAPAQDSLDEADEEQN
jgi:hypothetical protein